VPLHLQPAYRHLGIPQGSLPETEKAAATCLSLPLFPEISELQVEASANALKEAVKG
jgi:dTDP-4-amino-4,6-dideoxygalactose transaminase